MNMNQLLDQFLGTGNGQSPVNQKPASNDGAGLSGIASKIPGGLAGGAAAGGIVALLMGNKKARKFAGKAAGYGGAALLGGMAFKAFQNWNQARSDGSPSSAVSSETAETFHQQALTASDHAIPFELTLIRSMIAAARADGHIDSDEHHRIFSTVEQMQLSAEHKAFIFDSLQQDISVRDIAAQALNLEQGAEIYLSSCLVIDIDQASERAYLDALAHALGLPAELCREIETQADQQHSQAA